MIASGSDPMIGRVAANVALGACLQTNPNTGASGLAEICSTAVTVGDSANAGNPCNRRTRPKRANRNRVRGSVPLIKGVPLWGGTFEARSRSERQLEGLLGPHWVHGAPTVLH